MVMLARTLLSSSSEEIPSEFGARRSSNHVRLYRLDFLCKRSRLDGFHITDSQREFYAIARQCQDRVCAVAFDTSATTVRTHLSSGEVRLCGGESPRLEWRPPYHEAICPEGSRLQGVMHAHHYADDDGLSGVSCAVCQGSRIPKVLVCKMNHLIESDDRVNYLCFDNRCGDTHGQGIVRDDRNHQGQDVCGFSFVPGVATTRDLMESLTLKSCHLSQVTIMSESTFDSLHGVLLALLLMALGALGGLLVSRKSNQVQAGEDAHWTERRDIAVVACKEYHGQVNRGHLDETIDYHHM